MKKRTWWMLLGTLLISAVALAGCGGSGDNDAQQPEGDAPQDEVIEIVFSHNQAVGTPEDVGAQAMKEKLEELLGDRVRVELYPNQQLGDLRTQAEQTQLGEIHLTMQPVSTITPFVDDIKIIDFPYILPADREKVFEVLDGEVGQEGLARLSQGGFKGLGYWFEGYKLFTTKNKEIHSPADFKGMKIRVMESPLLIAQYTNWGATATPIAYAELYSALEQGTVDGQENPIQSIVSNRYYEVQGQIIQSYHGSMTYLLLANEAWFDGLPEDVQAAIIEAEEYGRKKSREAYAEQEQEYIQTVKDSGVNYYELTPEEIAIFQESVAPVYESQAATEWQREYVKKLQAAFEALEA